MEDLLSLSEEQVRCMDNILNVLRKESSNKIKETLNEYKGSEVHTYLIHWGFVTEKGEKGTKLYSINSFANHKVKIYNQRQKENEERELREKKQNKKEKERIWGSRITICTLFITSVLNVIQLLIAKEQSDKIFFLNGKVVQSDSLLVTKTSEIESINGKLALAVSAEHIAIGDRGKTLKERDELLALLKREMSSIEQSLASRPENYQVLYDKLDSIIIAKAETPRYSFRFEPIKYKKPDIGLNLICGTDFYFSSNEFIGSEIGFGLFSDSTNWETYSRLRRENLPFRVGWLFN